MKQLIVIIILTILISVLLFQNIQLYNIKDNENPKINDTITQVTSKSVVFDMISCVNKSNIKRLLTDFVNFGPKDTGSENCRKTAEFIFNEFSNMGLDVIYENWEYALHKDRNVVATLPGIDSSSDAVFILCAHYDTVGGAPGANDDGSGITAMIEIARVLSKYQFNHTIKFIAFSGHEIGLYGSFAYAKKAYFENENIIAVLMLDMIGSTTKAGNVIQVHKSQRAEWISKIIQETSLKYMEIINIVAEEIINTACDETSFIDFGYDGILFLQPNCWEPPNHCPEDDLDTINFPFLTNTTQLILASFVEIIKRPIDIQVRFTRPKECHSYLFDKIVTKLPGFNIKRDNWRALTYIIGSCTFKIKITTNEEINAVYYSVDDELVFNSINTDTPYDWTLKKPDKIRNRLKYLGYHKIGVTVTTFSGKTAYDEMDVYIIKQ